MADESIAPIPVEQQSEAIATIVSAFADNPVERWLYPDLQQYMTGFADFVAAFGTGAFDEHTAWGLDSFAAVALWYPPGAEPDGDTIAATLTRTVAPEKHDDTFSVLEQMNAAHPACDHWYLAWLAVRADRQGAGLGSRLLAPCLEIVDAGHLPTYLETPNPRSVPLYERHGFEVTGRGEAGTCPPIVFMERPAR